MNLLLDYQDQLINGTIMTIKLALTSLTIALIFGLLGAWAKLSSNRGWLAPIRPSCAACPIWC